MLTTTLPTASARPSFGGSDLRRSGRCGCSAGSVATMILFRRRRRSQTPPAPPLSALRHWQFTHPERLHFEKVPLIGVHLRRLAARLTGRPAEQLAMPFALEQPRLVVAALFAAVALFALTAAGLLARRR